MAPKKTSKAKKPTKAKKVTKEAKKTKPKKASFTDKLVKEAAKGKPPEIVENFYVEGSFPEDQDRIVMMLMRPTEQNKPYLGRIKAIAFSQDQKFKIWMSGHLGDDIASQMGPRHQMHVWAVQEGGKIRFDTETPIPNEARW